MSGKQLPGLLELEQLILDGAWVARKVREWVDA